MHSCFYLIFDKCFKDKISIQFFMFYIVVVVVALNVHTLRCWENKVKNMCTNAIPRKTKKTHTKND